MPKCEFEFLFECEYFNKSLLGPDWMAENDFEDVGDDDIDDIELGVAPIPIWARDVLDDDDGAASAGTGAGDTVEDVVGYWKACIVPTRERHQETIQHKSLQ